MTVTEKLKTAIKKIKDYGIFIVAVLITIIMLLPKIVPVPVPLPNSYPIANPSMDIAIKAYKDKDYDIALSHFLALSEAGDPLAQVMAGTMYEQGEGVKRDLCQFTYWIDKAARQGDFNAQLQLADSYRLSFAIKYDIDKSYMWLMVAKMNPNKQKSIRWYKDVSGIESNHIEIFKSMDYLYTEVNRQRLDKIFASWKFSNEPPVHVIRIRDIPYVNSSSIFTPAVKPCY